MKALSYQVLDCEILAGVLAKQGVKVTEVEDLSGKIPHTALGSAAKSTYFSPKSNRTVYVLEREQQYAADGFATDVWQFAEDFTAEEAAEFVRQYDAAKAAQ
jgi:hypothetical protein